MQKSLEILFKSSKCSKCHGNTLSFIHEIQITLNISKEFFDVKNTYSLLKLLERFQVVMKNQLYLYCSSLSLPLFPSPPSLLFSSLSFLLLPLFPDISFPFQYVWGQVCTGTCVTMYMSLTRCLCTYKKTIGIVLVNSKENLLGMWYVSGNNSQHYTQ